MVNIALNAFGPIISGIFRKLSSYTNIYINESTLLLGKGEGGSRLLLGSVQY